MLGCDDAGFADIQATALNAAISGSIFAVPEACFVMTMALPFGSTRARWLEPTQAPTVVQTPT
jgi:hypothetical protein